MDGVLNWLFAVLCLCVIAFMVFRSVRRRPLDLGPVENDDGSRDFR